MRTSLPRLRVFVISVEINWTREFIVLMAETRILASYISFETRLRGGNLERYNFISFGVRTFLIARGPSRVTMLITTLITTLVQRELQHETPYNSSEISFDRRKLINR